MALVCRTLLGGFVVGAHVTSQLSSLWLKLMFVAVVRSLWHDFWGLFLIYNLDVCALDDVMTNSEYSTVAETV